MSTGIVNERARKRFAGWDLDGDGRLQRSDFEREACRIAETLGRSVDCPAALNLRNAFLGMFDHLRQEAGGSAGDSLTEGQFARVAEDLVFEQGEAALDRVLAPMVQGIIGLCDANADGKINAEEFTRWLTALGQDRPQARAAFGRIDRNGAGALSMEELLAAVRGYHLGRLDVDLLP